MDATLEATIRERMKIEGERTAPLDEAIEIPPIPVSRYRDPEFFELEREHIWAKTWLLAGHESEWPEEGSYSLFDRTGANIVIVRGNDGVIRAFYNSCGHRGAPIIREECGTAKRLTCTYHSWSYDPQGELKAVPDARSFTGLDTAKLGLVPVGCQVWEGWVFVNQDPDAEDLVDFLGPIAEQMVEIDGPTVRKVGTQTHRVAANWKLMVDAFLEVYHIRTVHQDNAALLYDDQTVTVTMLPKGHSRLTISKRPGMAEMLAVPPEMDNPRIPDLWRETSTSFGIFPNIVVPMDTGAFAFLCMWPVDHRTTELELLWYAPEWEGDIPPDHEMRMTLFETVMAQDTANMSGIQASIESPGARPFHIGWHERLIHNFQRAVDLTIGPDRLPDGSAVSDALDRFVGD